MKTGLILFLTLILTLPAGGMASAASSMDRENAANRFKRDFPQFHFNSIIESPVAGVYTVISDENIVYYAPEGGYLFFGEMWTKDGSNLTQALKDQVNEKKLAKLPLDKAIKIGNGPKKVIEVTDPDCPFCRKASLFFDNREAEITRYVFLFPIKALHPNAEAKSKMILASTDKVKTFRAVMAGEYDNVQVPDITDNDALSVHQEVGEMMGVTGTPTIWIDGTKVSGANIPVFEKLLE